MNAVDSKPLRAICLMGPTASGKTAVAIELNKLFPCELISVDSAQVYTGMDIGTAKPVSEVLAAYPHRLINIREPTQQYSAGEFCRDAILAMEEITRALSSINPRRSSSSSSGVNFCRAVLNSRVTPSNSNTALSTISCA